MNKLLFSKNHIWVLLNGDSAKVGITDYAQQKLGDILFLNLPDVEDTLKVGETFGDVESVKLVSDLISPMNGYVVSINEDLVDEPELINNEPYSAWFAEIKEFELSKELMTEEEYKEFVESL